MNRKLLIAAIAVVIIIVGAFAISNNASSQIGNSVNIDANALEDMKNIDKKRTKERKQTMVMLLKKLLFQLFLFEYIQYK